MRRAVLKYFQDCRYVQEQMDSMRTPAVNRVLFFSASNGGGIPKAGSKMSTSTILWSLSESAQSKFPVGGYQNTPLDGHYIGLLERLMAKEKMHVDPATIEIETQIGSIYHAEKVKDSYWFYLGVKGNSFLYMSVSSTEFKFEPDTITQMDVAVNNIRARLK